ncbi:MAG: hypothetical protein L0Y72_08580 [Gemmataceae bacterium]|nr:hypothetical protein [Gemmataceae bacterium]MCI0739086.1 hypothetical protein [Gemmataceae bacterium]
MAKKDDSDSSPALNDAYTGMLAISLLALIVGCVMLWLDYSQYSGTLPTSVPKAPLVVQPQK